MVPGLLGYVGVLGLQPVLVLSGSFLSVHASCVTAAILDGRPPALRGHKLSGPYHLS